MRLKLGKKLGTASLNSKFIGSKKQYNLRRFVYFPTINFKGAFRHLKIEVWKKFFFTLIKKYN